MSVRARSAVSPAIKKSPLLTRGKMLLTWLTSCQIFKKEMPFKANIKLIADQRKMASFLLSLIEQREKQASNTQKTQETLCQSFREQK